MKALSASERALLVHLAYGQARHATPPEREVIRSLALRGCASYRVIEPDPDGDAFVAWSITERGRLALRVAGGAP